MSDLDLFHYYYQDNQAPDTLFLLHGTGGDERDLLPIVNTLSERYNFVGIRGNISENGMPRFFRRFEMGVFDQESITEESEKLSSFLRAWQEEHAITPAQTAFLGYSNGANMILAMTFRFPELITKAVLLHSMLPIEPEKVNLGNKQFLVTLGENDQMIPAEEGRRVARTLMELGAEVKEVAHQGGHEIRALEIEAIEAFLGKSE